MTSDDEVGSTPRLSHKFGVMGARITQEEFLKRAAQRFGEQFDYSLMRWRSYKSPVQIRCNEHPVQPITITPEKHLQTLGGCRHCLRERRIASLERELNRKSADRPDSGSLESTPPLEQATPKRMV